MDFSGKGKRENGESGIYFRLKKPWNEKEKPENGKLPVLMGTGSCF
jgi:hypothetical protein